MDPGHLCLKISGTLYHGKHFCIYQDENYCLGQPYGKTAAGGSYTQTSSLLIHLYLDSCVPQLMTTK